MEFEMLQISEKKNENPCIEIFLAFKLMFTCNKKLKQYKIPNN